MGDVTYLQFRDSQEARARIVKNKVPIGWVGGLNEWMVW